jgi:hypothetical protein
MTHTPEQRRAIDSIRHRVKNLLAGGMSPALVRAKLTRENWPAGAINAAIKEGQGDG